MALKTSIESGTNSTIGRYENVRIIKNVTILGFAFMIHFIAFHGTANLQSSVNTDQSLGALTLAAIYGSLIVSNIFLPVAIIKWIGCKWTIALSFITYMPFIGAQFYPRLYTLIPAGIAVGLGGAPLWCAKCTYLTVIAEAFSTIVNGGGGDTKQEVIVVRFFGLFFVFYQMAQVWGNLISSSVLTSGSQILENITDTNITTDLILMKNVGEVCGGRFCPGISVDINPNLKPPEPEKIQLLSGIFLGFMLCAVLLVTFFVDSLKRYDLGRKGSGSGLSGFSFLIVTIKQLFKRKQLLLLPITMFIGAEQAFIAADFTASFVACGWGVPNIGYAMICFGVANAIAAAIAGGLTKLIGRFPIVIITIIIHGSLLIWMKFWIAIENDYWSYCGMAAIWGLTDGILLVQINSFYGVLFAGSEEAAFSTFRVCEACGSVITYILSPMLCSGTKLIFLFILMLIGVFGYSLVEYFRRKDIKKNSLEINTAVYTNEACDAL